MSYVDDDDLQHAVENLFIGSVPERSSDLQDLWHELQLKFRLFEDADGPKMEAGAYRYVHFNNRMLRVFWVSAFAAWEAYEQSTLAVIGGVADLTRLKELLKVAHEVMNAPDPEAVSLVGLPGPGHLPDKREEPERRAAAELAILAVGWAMLHEVRHLQHQQESTSGDPYTSPTDARKEELSCDAFATEFLMCNLDVYANLSGSDPEQVRQKRSLGIYFAMFAIVVLGYPNWLETDSHPAVQERLGAVRRRLSGNEFDSALCIAQLAFSALQAVWPSAPRIVD